MGVGSFLARPLKLCAVVFRQPAAAGAEQQQTANKGNGETCVGPPDLG